MTEHRPIWRWWLPLQRICSCGSRLPCAEAGEETDSLGWADLIPPSRLNRPHPHRRDGDTPAYGTNVGAWRSGASEPDDSRSMFRRFSDR
ncbi:MAG TPA: hypothetical protein VFC00_39330 [Micromonosporaceae bacterium]|nr:hypothetical protein [Micromonosporaceae bacterium]